MSTAHYSRNLEDVLSKLRGVKKNQSGYIALCPAHDDKNPSLSVSAGDDGRVLLKCFAGCSTEDILAALGLEFKDLFPDDGNRGSKEIVATYDYRDEKGRLLYQIVRFEDKSFAVRRPNGQWGLGSVKPVLYRLPELLASDPTEPVFIFEGEKDADNARQKLGLVATTNPFGAGKWRPEYSEHLRGRHVVIVPDNDQEGRKHAQKVANSLHGVAASVKIVELPDLPPGGDVSDWLAQGHIKEEFLSLVEKSVLCTTPIYTACTQTTETAQIRLRTWSEVVSDSVEDREWVVSGMLPQTGLVVLGGWAKEGKSTLAIHLCRSVAQGKPFLGREAEKMPAVYINYEMPEDYRAELMAASDIPEGAYWLDRPEHVLSIETIRKIIEEANSEHGLLVIDTFRGAFRPLGESENQAGGAGVIIRDLQKVAIETGWLILLIHHKNKSGRLSGTGDFQAAADVIMLWKRPNPAEPGTLEVEGRMAPIEPMAVRLTLEAAEYIGDAKEALAAEDMKRVLAALTDDPAQASEIAEQLGIPSGSVRVYLSRLYRDGKVLRSGSGKRGDPYLYYKDSVENVESVQKGIVHNTETKEDLKEKDRWRETFGGDSVDASDDLTEIII